MMSLPFGLFTQVSGSGPLGPLVLEPWDIVPSYEISRQNTGKLFPDRYLLSRLLIDFSHVCCSL